MGSEITGVHVEYTDAFGQIQHINVGADDDGFTVSTVVPEGFDRLEVVPLASEEAAHQLGRIYLAERNPAAAT